MTNLHILSYDELNESFEIEYNQEVAYVSESYLKELINTATTVTYTEDEEGETEYRINRLNLGHIEVEIDADGSGEHDVYMHAVTVRHGEVKKSVRGEHLKTYKRESSAIKFANSYNMEVKVN